MPEEQVIPATIVLSAKRASIREKQLATWKKFQEEKDKKKAKERNERMAVADESKAMYSTRWDLFTQHK